MALRCGDKWQPETILGHGNENAALIPVYSLGWGLLTTDQSLRDVPLNELSPERIPDFTCAGLRCGLVTEVRLLVSRVTA